MQTWELDPATGDYVIENGVPAVDSGQKTSAYIRLRAPRGNWLYAPNDNWGSDFYLMRQRFGARDIKSVTEVANKALKPIIEEGRAVSIRIDPELDPAGSRNNLQFKTTIFEQSGDEQVLSLPPLGGT